MVPVATACRICSGRSILASMSAVKLSSVSRIPMVAPSAGARLNTITLTL